MKKQKIVVICGPTAVGKTKLGIEVAKKLDGEIISADSKQIYKDMYIGSATPTKEEQLEAKHHLIDFVSPEQRFTVFDFKKEAEKKIEEIFKRGKTPIIVGGTGLYINSLIYNIEYPEYEIDLEKRKELEAEDIEILYKKANEIDEIATSKISPNDRKRLIRIIEMYNSTGKTKTELEKESRKEPKYDYRIFLLNMDREKLYNRINLRTDLMIKTGLVEETKNLIRKYKEFPTSIESIGYKEIVGYLKNEYSLDEAIEMIKLGTRRLAKRQLTWFRAYKEKIELDYENNDNVQIICENFRN